MLPLIVSLQPPASPAPQSRVNKKPTVHKGWKYFWSCYKFPPCGSKPTFIQSSSSWEKAEEQADISDSSSLLAQSLSQTRASRTQRSQIKDETRAGGLRCSVEVQNPLSLSRTSSHPHILQPLIVTRPLGYSGNSLSTGGPLEWHICMTQTSDRKLGWHSLWAIVPALVGKPFVCKSTQWTIRAPSAPGGVVSCSCCARTAALPTKGL